MKETKSLCCCAYTSVSTYSIYVGVIGIEALKTKILVILKHFQKEKWTFKCNLTCVTFCQ